MSARSELISQIAATIVRRPTPFVLRVGIDGVDGAGKSVFGDELGRAIEGLGRRVIRASVDGFHNPRAVRYRQGRHSPEGFFEDSYNYPLLQASLLDPLSPGGSGRFRTAAFDHRQDVPVEGPLEEAVPGDILVFDGIFLHRPVLRPAWDFSIFLEVGFDHSVPRGAQRDGTPPDPEAPENRRYVEGQRLYLRSCEPQRHATLVINNEQLAAPFVVRGALTP